MILLKRIVRQYQGTEKPHSGLPVLGQPLAFDTDAGHIRVDAEIALYCNESGVRLMNHSLNPRLPHHRSIELFVH